LTAIHATPIWKRLESDYLSQHTDPRNRRLHAIGVPSIVLSVLLLLQGAGPSGVALGVTLSFALSYLALARVDALPTVVLLVLAHALAWWMVESVGGGVPWVAAAVLFFGGWLLQLWGHHLEGNRPAFLSNVRHLWVAPMALVREALRRAPSSAGEPGD